jgi:hypothetical protein
MTMIIREISSELSEELNQVVYTRTHDNDTVSSLAFSRTHLLTYFGRWFIIVHLWEITSYMN